MSGPHSPNHEHLLYGRNAYILLDGQVNQGIIFPDNLFIINNYHNNKIINDTICKLHECTSVILIFHSKSFYNTNVKNVGACWEYTSINLTITLDYKYNHDNHSHEVIKQENKGICWKKYLWQGIGGNMDMQTIIGSMSYVFLTHLLLYVAAFGTCSIFWLHCQNVTNQE